MLKIPLFIKSMAREWRSGELTLLFSALIIAVTCISAMNYFTTMVQYQLERGAANMLGADAMITSNQPIAPAWVKKINSLGITQTTTLSFLSMVEFENQLQLSQIKAITSPYPLRGILKIAFEPNDTIGNTLYQAPEPGTVWISPRLIVALSTAIGKTLRIGAASFKITGIIREEPGQTGDWFTLSPRILMNQNDVPKTEIIQPGSQLTYNVLLNGSKSELNNLHTFLKDKLQGQQKWLDSQNNVVSVTNTINRTLTYLNFGTLMSLVLAGVAVSMASLRYSQRHFKHVALLRCFGASQRQIMTLYLSSLALFGIIACVVGAVLGYALQPLLIRWLGALLPQTEQYFTIGPFVLSIMTGMLLLFCFSSGSICQLRKVSPVSLFRQQHLIWDKQTYYTYGLALLLLGFMAYYYTHSLTMTMAVLTSCMVFVAIVLIGLWLLFRLPIKARIPLNWRFGFNNIARNMEDSALQVTGIGLALATILSLMLLKNNLINDWKNQLPAQTANYFLFNMEPEQLPLLKQTLQQNQILVDVFYPTLRGRIVSINNQSVKTLFGEEAKNINALQRELNLSWSRQLPEGNKVIKGSWVVSNPKIQWVSVESELAERLKLKLGDTIEFAIGGDELSIQVTSFRTLDWSSFKPNFFMLFKPGLLDERPSTLITSFYLPPEKQQILIELTKQFPNISLIDITSTLKKVQSILTSASHAITFIATFALLAGIIIVILAMLSLSGMKQQETSVLKILGMRRNTLLLIRSSEAFLIGMYSGLLAIIAAVALNIYLAVVILGSHFSIPWLYFVIVPFCTAILVVLLNLLIQWSQYQKRR